MKTFKQYLESLSACEVAIEWAADKNIEEEVAECHRGDWLLWLAQKCGVELQSITLARGRCANTVRHPMRDKRSLKAVDVAIAYRLNPRQLTKSTLNKDEENFWITHV